MLQAVGDSTVAVRCLTPPNHNPRSAIQMKTVLWSEVVAAFCAGYDDSLDKMGRKVYFDFDKDICTMNFIDVRLMGQKHTSK